MSLGRLLGRARVCLVPPGGVVAGLGPEVDSKAPTRHTWAVFQPHTNALSILPSLSGPIPASPAHLVTARVARTGTCRQKAHAPPYRGGREHGAGTAQGRLAVE